MRYLAALAGLLLVVIAVAAAREPSLPFEQQPTYVVAFSAAQARYLSLEPEPTWLAILNELRPTSVRLQANWNEVEPESGKYSFDELDKLVAAAQSAGAKITLAVGRKLPRWPECHDPAWLKHLSPDEMDSKLMALVRATVEHYRDNAALVRWQVENEPMFAYGACVSPNWHRLVREVALVRQLDPTRPILVTDSGELSSWWETARLADEQGTTLYRVTWNPVFHYFRYPLFPYYYRLKAALIAPFVSRTVVSELQLEPWAPQGLKVLPVSEIRKSLSPDMFRQNVTFFQRTGLPEAFVWGAEWWYYAKVKLGHAEYWDMAKQLFNSTAGIK